MLIPASVLARLYAAITFVTVVASVAWGQPPGKKSAMFEPVRLVLATSGEARATSVTAATMFGPIWCDDRDSVYVRVAPPRSNVVSAPVTRIAANGEMTVFDIANIPGVQYKAMRSFAISVERTGRVHAVAAYVVGDVEQQFLVSFSSDGSFLSKVPLDANLVAYQLVALPPDRFFISGLRKAAGKARDQAYEARDSFTAIFDRDARLVKNLKSKLDDSDIQPAGNPPMEINTAIQLGAALLGPDSNLYVLKGGSPPRLQVFSASGQKLHEFHLWTPFKNAEARDLLLGAGRFFIRFQAESADPNAGAAVALVAFDADTGEPRTVYDVDGVRGQLACSADDAFTVLTVMPSGRYGVIKATTR